MMLLMEVSHQVKGFGQMGSDIGVYVEVKSDNEWEYLDLDIFDYRNYGMYAFFCDVRNYSMIAPLDAARGLPDDVTGYVESELEYALESFFTISWLSADELINFDYNQTFEDRRGDGGISLPIGEGEVVSIKEFLGEYFWKDLERLRELRKNYKDVRIIIDID